MPSCGYGSYITNSNCGKCAAGKYTSSFAVTECADCKIDTYSDTIGTSSCLQCAWPRGNLVAGLTLCENYYLNINTLWVLISVFFFVTTYVLSLGDTRSKRFIVPLITSSLLHFNTCTSFGLLQWFYTLTLFYINSFFIYIHVIQACISYISLLSSFIHRATS